MPRMSLEQAEKLYTSDYEKAVETVARAQKAIGELGRIVIPTLDTRAYAIRKLIQRERDELREALRHAATTPHVFSTCLCIRCENARELVI